MWVRDNVRRKDNALGLTNGAPRREDRIDISLSEGKRYPPGCQKERWRRGVCGWVRSGGEVGRRDKLLSLRRRKREGSCVPAGAVCRMGMWGGHRLLCVRNVRGVARRRVHCAVGIRLTWAFSSGYLIHLLIHSTNCSRASSSFYMPTPHFSWL